MIKLRFLALALISCGMLTACDSTKSLVTLRQSAAPSNPYNAAIAKAYTDYSAEKQAAYEWWDSKYFADKGLLAVGNRTVLPEEPAKWDIADTIQPELEAARKQLIDLFDKAVVAKPSQTAEAVVALDRWIALAEAGWNTPKIEEARDNYFAALEKLQVAEETKEEEPAATEEADKAKETLPFKAPEVKKPALPVESTSAVVYFPFNSAEVNGTAKKVIEHLVEYIKSAGDISVVIHGHTDHSGSDSYNMALSKKRADAVANYLTSVGVSEKIISRFAFGASDLKVPTAEGVREYRNRRVEIFVE